MGQYNDEDEELPAGTEDSEEAQDAGEQDSEPTTPAAPPAEPKPAQPADGGKPSVRDYIAKKYGLVSPDQYAAAAGDNSSVAAARDKAADTKANAGIAEGLSQMFSGAHGLNKTTANFYNQQRQDADKLVAQAQGDKTAKLQALLAQNKVSQEGLQAESEMDNMAEAKDRRDPTSDASKSLRGFIKSVAPNMAMDPSFDKASYEQLSKVYGPLVTAYESAEARKESAKTRAQQVALSNQQRQDAKDAAAGAKNDQTELANARKDFAGLGKDLDDDLASGRSSLGVAKNKINTARRVLSFAHVDEDEIEAARKDPQAAAALTDKMNKLSPEQYAEVVNGLMSTVAPGNGSMHQFDELRALTLEQRKAKLKEYFTSNPEAANAGPLIMNNLMSLGNEINTGKKILSEHTDKMKVKHPAAFAHPETAGQAEALLGKYAPSNDEASAAPATTAAPKPRAVSAQELTDYATKHGTTPENAAKFLTSQGYTIGK